MRAVVYTRQSFDRTGGGAAVARQLDDCRRLAELRGWEVVAEYSDNDVSAAGGKARPGFAATLGAIETGQAGAVIAWAVDRLTRNRRDTQRLIETCQTHSATVALVRGSDLDMATPAGRMVAGILSEVARAEIETKGDRQRKANAQRAERGLPPSGRRAVGYTADGMNVIESEAAMIREGYHRILAGGSIRSIARDWTRGGFRTSLGNEWRPDAVRHVIMNARYAGLRVHRGENVGAGIWPAIVPEETYRAAVGILTSPGRSTVADRSIKYLLTNIAGCGTCGEGLMATGRTHRGARTYKCRARADLAVAGDRIDAYVESVIVERLARPDAAQLLSPPQGGEDVPMLRSEANALRARSGEALDLFAAGTITKAQLERIMVLIEGDLKAVEDRLSTAGRVDVVAHLVGVDDVEAAWDQLDVLSQRAVIKALFSRIVLHSPGKGMKELDPRNVELEWRGPAA